MIKTVLYNYLGTNGTLTTPIHLEDIYYTRSIKLMADMGKKLRNIETGTVTEVIIVPDDEVDNWVEE